jgi:hypothetical protein
VALMMMMTASAAGSACLVAQGMPGCSGAHTINHWSLHGYSPHSFTSHLRSYETKKANLKAKLAALMEGDE